MDDEESAFMRFAEQIANGTPLPWVTEDYKAGDPLPSGTCDRPMTDEEFKVYLKQKMGVP